MLPESTRQRLGENIARQRKLAGFTQKQVAEALKINVQTVSRLETGSISPTMSRLWDLHDLFNCSLHLFFESAGPEIRQDLMRITNSWMVLSAGQRKEAMLAMRHLARALGGEDR